MPELKIVPTSDKSTIEKIYLDDSIRAISHDHRAAIPIFHPLANYLAAYVDGVLSGGFLMIRSTEIEMDLHALLWRSALKNGRDLGVMCIAAAFSFEKVERVTAYVVECLKSVRNYCLKLGFQSEGVRRNACMRNGKLYGVETFGMTRNEWGRTWGS